MIEDNKVGCLKDRQLIEISGAEAASFLQALITTDIKALSESVMMAGALLSPQGKILFDFLVGKQENGFFLDSPATQAEALSKRLSLYKLRSKVDITRHESMTVTIARSVEGGAKFCFRDGRFGENDKIMRLYTTNDQSCQQNRQEWDRLRISAALAESGTDFALGDVFAHDINLDQIGGVSFNKGCYIGQEVVSRMQYRGTAKRRLLQVEAQLPLPPSGTALEAAGKPIGVLGSSYESKGLAQGLAIVRLDRVKQALDKGQKITANGLDVTLTLPQRVSFTYPDTSTSKTPDEGEA